MIVEKMRWSPQYNQRDKPHRQTVLLEPEVGRKLGFCVCSEDEHRVDKVEEGSVAQQAGLEVSDIIIEVGGYDVGGLSHEHLIKRMIESARPLELKIIKAFSGHDVPELINPVVSSPRAKSPKINHGLSNLDRALHNQEMVNKFGQERKRVIVTHKRSLGMTVASGKIGSKCMIVTHIDPELICGLNGIVPGDVLVAINYMPLPTGQHIHLPKLLERAEYPLVLNFNAIQEGKLGRFKGIMIQGVPIKKYHRHGTLMKYGNRMMFMDSNLQILIIAKRGGISPWELTAPIWDLSSWRWAVPPIVINVHDIEDIHVHPSRDNTQFIIEVRETMSTRQPQLDASSGSLHPRFYRRNVHLACDNQRDRDDFVCMLRLLIKNQQYTYHLQEKRNGMPLTGTLSHLKRVSPGHKRTWRI